MKRIYLASPYSGTPEEQEARFRAACRVAGQLIRQGFIVYSPIAHSHPICEATRGLPGTWGFWERIDRTFIEWADEVRVLMLPGYECSRGVKAEIQIAKQAGKPVVHMQYTGKEVK